MIGTILTILAFCFGFYLAALSRQKEEMREYRKNHDKMAYFKDCPYPSCYITQETYLKYQKLLREDVIYIITDDIDNQNWTSLQH